MGNRKKQKTKYYDALNFQFKPKNELVQGTFGLKV